MKLHRRDMLKLAAWTLGAATLSAPLSRLARAGQASSRPNIIILIFDTLTARNMSLYGYSRITTPNFARFAERSIIYHNHNSSGNFTSPGTASLLTGMYPWTHRALNHSGLIRRDMSDRNIFALMGEGYFRTGFAQTGWASFLLTQFMKDIDQFLPASAFGDVSRILGDDLPDTMLAYRALDDFMFKVEKAPASLILGSIERTLLYSKASRISQAGFPRGVPVTGMYPVYFKLEHVFAGLAAMLADLRVPQFSYLHLFPPHAPYSPRREFYGMFRNDGFFPPEKPVHKLSDGHDARKVYIGRMSYDEYLASVDYEFGRFVQALEENGILDNSYLIITSDHGEMMERGEKEHDTPLLYDPVIHVPLLVSAPGQRKRVDIHSPTNNVDILPTVLHLAGRSIPDWCEGQILPGVGGEQATGRSTFTVDAKLSPAYSPLPTASIAMRKGSYKLIHYRGYFGIENWFELYDHENDIEELVDLYDREKTVAAEMRDELLERFDQANLEFQKK